MRGFGGMSSGMRTTGDGRGASRIPIAILIVALGAEGCLRDESLAALDGAIAVEWLVDKELGGGGRGVGIRELEVFRFTRPQPLEVTLDEKWRSRPWRRLAPLLAESPSGTELAYRADPGAPWRVAYLGKAAPLAVPHCRIDLGNGDAPDWARLVTYDRAAPAIAQCMGPSQALSALAKDRGGDRAVADLLLATRAEPVRAPTPRRPTPPGPYDVWEGAVDSLPPAEKARVLDALRGDLATAGSSAAALSRALWRTEPIDPSLLLARARELAGRTDRGPLDVLLARLATALPAEAGAIACSALPTTLSSPFVPAGDRSTLAVVAATRAPCPTVTALLLQRAAQREYLCQGQGEIHLCSEQELAPRVSAYLGELATDRWFYSDHGGLDGWQALLAAGHAQGALPGPFLAATERLLDQRAACVAFEAWRLRSTDEAQAIASSEEWNAAKTPAERVAVRRKKALAHATLGKRAPELADPVLRAIEVRWNECATRWGVRFAEEAAAYEAGDAAAIAAAEDRSFQLYQECMAIDLEGRLHCQRQGAWPP